MRRLLALGAHVARLLARKRLSRGGVLGRTVALGGQLLLAAELIQSFVGHEVSFRGARNQAFVLSVDCCLLIRAIDKLWLNVNDVLLRTVGPALELDRPKVGCGGEACGCGQAHFVHAVLALSDTLDRINLLSGVSRLELVSAFRIRKLAALLLLLSPAHAHVR